MNELPMTIGGQEPLTMTSREIADLTGKRHDNVMADIRKMLAELHGEGGVLSFQDTQTNPQNGQTYPVFMLPKRETLILVSGYSVAMRARIIDRWQELEARNADPMRVLNDPAAMRGLLLGYTEKVLALESKVVELVPKAAALDRIANTDGSLCLTSAAKTMQCQPRKFMQRLQQLGWIYRRPGGSTWLAYQDKLSALLLEHKVSTGEKGDGTEWTGTQVRVTPKGLAKLARLFELENSPVQAELV